MVDQWVEISDLFYFSEVATTQDMSEAIEKWRIRSQYSDVGAARGVPNDLSGFENRVPSSGKRQYLTGYLCLFTVIEFPVHNAFTSALSYKPPGSSLPWVF